MSWVKTFRLKLPAPMSLDLHFNWLPRWKDQRLDVADANFLNEVCRRAFHRTTQHGNGEPCKCLGSIKPLK